jgi:hypothetical protein
MCENFVLIELLTYCSWPFVNIRLREHLIFQVFIVTNMTIARQRFGKYVLKVTQSAVKGPPLLGSKSLGTFNRNGQNTGNNRRIVRCGGFSSIRPEL